jgi:hypothetical protein
MSLSLLKCCQADRQAPESYHAENKDIYDYPKWTIAYQIPVRMFAIIQKAV